MTSDNREGLLEDPNKARSTTGSDATTSTGSTGGMATGGASSADTATGSDYVVTRRSESSEAQATTQADSVATTTAQPTQPVTSGQSSTVRSTSGADESLRVQRYEEELQANTVERQAGTVRIEKDVVEEERTLEVPVSREEVHVRSVTPSTSSVSTAEAFQEGVIEVPLTEEDVVARKQVRVVEELEIEKSAVTETERVSDTVRKEVVDIQEVGELDVDRRNENPLDETIRPG